MNRFFLMGLMCVAFSTSAQNSSGGGAAGFVWLKQWREKYPSGFSAFNMSRLFSGANSRVESVGAPVNDCVLGLRGIAPITIADKWPGGIKTMDEVEGFICRYGAVRGDFCSVFGHYRRQVEAAAEATKMPPQALACVVLIESQFHPGLTSPAGARGLAQFMPGTARYTAGLIQSRYVSEWSQYQYALGTQRPVSEVTASRISGSGGGTSDVEIFASAIYLRDIIGQSEDFWAYHLQRHPTDINKIFDYAIAGYNAGPGNGRVASYPNVLHANPGTSMLSGGLPAETRNYLVKFRDCMGKGVTNFQQSYRGNNCPLKPSGGVCQ